MDNKIDNNILCLLQSAIVSGIIDLNEVQNKIDNMNNQAILEKQEEFCKIWLATDGRYKVKVPDPTKKTNTRLIAKKSEDLVKKEIIKHYKNLYKQEEKVTISSLFPKWRQKQINKGRSTRTIRHYDSNWDKYYIDCPLMQKSILDISEEELEDWCDNLITSHKMTKKKFYNVTVIIRGCFKMAKKNKLLTINTFEQIEIDKEMFEPVPRYRDLDRVFTKDEQQAITKEAFNDFKETDNVACLGIPLCFKLGPRVSELATLQWADINYYKTNYISIRRMESKEEHQRADGSYSPATRVVVDHTKTENGLRDVFLCQASHTILDMIRDWQERHNIQSDFIFSNDDGNWIYTTAFVSRIEKYCEHIGITPKRMHCIRRTYISTLFDNNIHINTIMKQAGHADKQTTLNNYVYDRCTEEEKDINLENALRD